MYTPMMQQYLEKKEEARDALLFFRLGDFYEMFFEDAKSASKVLGLALTSRLAGKGNRVPMCGLPYHAAPSYIARLIKAGFKVAVCEQAEAPEFAKGLVNRSITRFITPGTLVESNLLEQGENNYLAALNRDGRTSGVSIVDLSTGEFRITEFSNDEELLSELVRISPAECIVSDSFKEKCGGFLKSIKERTGTVWTVYDDRHFEYEEAFRILTTHFKTRSLQGFGCEKMPLAVGSAGVIIRYLEETQKTSLKNINRLSAYSLSEYMNLDMAAQRNLELLRNIRGEKDAPTLFNVLNSTRTPMGTRLLAKWVLHPLLDCSKINQRLDAVEQLLNDGIRGRIREVLKEIYDIERLISRISLGTANPRDLIMLSSSLNLIPELKNSIPHLHLRGVSEVFSLLEEVREGLGAFPEINALIEGAIVEMPPLSINEGNIIQDGHSPELDKLRTVLRDGKGWIAYLQKKEKERTGIGSLKVRFNNVFGYYIEVTKPNLHLVPSDYIRKQTMVNAERFITPELKEYEETIVGAQEKAIELEKRLFGEIVERVTEEVEGIQKTAQMIALLDVLANLAEVAVKQNYVKPRVDEGERIVVRQSRHPVLEEVVEQGRFIPNDINLDRGQNGLLIITGPNMAGKSTYIRQVALIVLMAQMGSFVPAKEARIGIVDRIWTRIGASDDLSGGMSTFMMEMNETANILNNATSRSLIILDEIGRGTSTFDGLSIAWAVCEYIHNNPALKARTLFATHYHELTELALTLEGVKNYNISVKESNGEVVFLYKLKEGSSDHSYGIYVGQLAGLPKEVTERAKEILNNLEIVNITTDGKPAIAKKRRPKEEKGQMDFLERTETSLLLFPPSPNHHNRNSYK